MMALGEYFDWFKNYLSDRTQYTASIIEDLKFKLLNIEYSQTPEYFSYT